MSQKQSDVNETKVELLLPRLDASGEPIRSNRTPNGVEYSIPRPTAGLKWYLVDTNSAFNNPEVLEKYNCVIPSHILREVEHLELTRKADKQLQFQIRRFKNALDANEHIHVDLLDYRFNMRDEWDGNYTDNILVQICVEEGYGLISNDRLLKDKCRMYGVEVVELGVDENYEENKGFLTTELSHRQLQFVMESPQENSFGLMINQYMIVNNVVDGELLDIVKWDGSMTKSLRDENGKLGAGFSTFEFNKFKPKDEYQIMAVDSIFSNPITSLRGKAGSGKSLIALNASWSLVEKEGYKLVIFVNPVPSADAQELGFYKGDKLEKLMQSSVGSMLKSKFGGSEEDIVSHILAGRLDILPFADLRGFDTGDRTIVWILEAQNLTSELMKLGLQRVGEGSKVIVDGDFHQQIDRAVYESDNGMKRMSEVFRGTDLFGEVELQNVHRSRIADIADKM